MTAESQPWACVDSSAVARLFSVRMWPIFVPSLDLTYLTHRPDNTLAPNETAALAIARRDNDLRLEVTDFSDSEICGQPPADLQPTGCQQRKISALWSHRRKLLERLVTVVGAPLQQHWPELDLADVVHLIDHYAPNARDLSTLVSKLVNAIINQPNRKDQNVKAVRLFCLTWLILYNLGEAHTWWIASGKPAVPDVPMGAFVSTSLTRIERNIASLGQMPADAGMGAAYDFKDNALLFQPEWVTNPLHVPDPRHGDINIYGAIPHELFHAEWDARGKPISRARHEIDALIFEYKTSILVRGLEQPMAFATAAFDARQNVTRKILAPTEGVVNFFAEVGLLYYDTVLFQKINERCLALAIRELESGRILHGERNKLVPEYAKAHTMVSTVLFTYYSSTSARYSESPANAEP